MTYTIKLVAILLVFLLAPTVVLSARNLKPESQSESQSLAERLKLDQGGSKSNSWCWDSLFELQSCSSEVVLFFVNGETHLGPTCCNAVRVIQNQCWPSMLGSLGITTQEADILLGFCDASAASGGGSSPATPMSATCGP